MVLKEFGLPQCSSAQSYKVSASYLTDGEPVPSMEAKAKILGRVNAIAALRPVNFVDSQQGSQANARIEGRRRAFQNARLILEDGNEIRCILKDISKSGARIIVQAAEGLPPIVTLVIETTALKIRASVKWRRDNQAGLRWLGTSSQHI